MIANAIKEIRFFKLRYILIGFILFFVASLVFIINGLANGLANENIASLKNMDVHALYIDKDSNNRLEQSRFSATDIDEIKKQNGLEPFALQMFSLETVENNKKLDVTLMAVNPNSFLMPAVTEGDSVKQSKDPQLVVNDSLKEEGVEIGDELYEENSGVTFKVVGFTEKETYSHTPVVFVSLEVWEGMLGDNVEPFYNAIVIKNEQPELAKMVDKAVNHGIWVSTEDVIKGMPSHQAEQTSLNMMLIFLIVIAVFVLAAFFYIMTIQKLNQFGVLKAIGAKNGFLVGTTILQVFFISSVSISIAIGFAKLMQVLLPSSMPFVFNPLLIFAYAGILVLVSILGALFSTRNIIKVDPKDAIGRVE
ncbi:ABC transporter permease [Bacillus kwashiorkori]|uniref:ABC transporter permease n=1 Tax=Bacillus kwashiorkori TaxID=1522318 RepID=UPI0007826049|nr:ABC transporter permease [Bacillus kwashiorkori]